MMDISKEAERQMEAVARETGAPAPKGAFFRKCDWAAFWIAGLATLAVYFFTLAPTVTLEDSGELAVASDYLGVPHPPGYPIWTLITWLFQLAFHWVKYNGHPNPAWSVGLASAVAGAGACGLLALLISRSGADLLEWAAGGKGKGVGDRSGRLLCAAAGVAGGLLLAFSPVLWSQSVIVEVYALNALFQMGVVLLIYMWMKRPERVDWLWWASFLFGLGLTNHQTLLFLALALVLAVLVKDADLFRDFVASALFMAPAFLLAWKGVGVFWNEESIQEFVQKGMLPGWQPDMWKWSAGPDTGSFWLYNFSFLAVPAAIWTGWRTRKMPAGRRFLWGLAATAAVYLAMVACNRYFISEPMPKPEGFMAHYSPWIVNGLTPAADPGQWSPFEQFVWKAQGTGATYQALAWLILLLPLGAAMLKLPHGRTVAVSILLAELGVAFYLYMPVASDQNPPMNWGYARTWAGFMHAVTRGQYEAIVATDIFSQKFVEQLGTYLTDLRSQFTLPITVLGFLPFCAWGFRAGGKRRSALPVALGLLLASLPFFAAEAFGASTERAYRLLIAPVLLGAGWGMALMTAGWLKSLVADWRGRGIATRVFTAGFLAVLALGVLWVDWKSCQALWPSAESLAEAQSAGRSVVTLDDGSLAFLEKSGRLFFLALMAVPPLGLAAAWALGKERFGGFRMDFGEGAQRWMLTSVVGFFAVSVVFLIFQNPSMDIQQLFIGRVQFIQSHAFYALWLGYGALLAGGCAARWGALGGREWGRRAVAGAAVAAVLLPGALLWQNAFDEEQIRIVGGAEQNGHSYGWQFGNWGLEGVKGIKEDFGYWYGGEDSEEFKAQWGAYCEAMGSDDPSYPPPMTEGAVFYGGTDPGRFVPTYMIYSADVRSDVYLITQNALADNTFMNVTRDLYGDTIYIPSVEESNQAFQRYVEDVQAGRIAAGADIKFENGRVSVQGVGGVMAINGILAKLIFEENKDKHDFYVEESYAIQWMYPYLQPNGIMLKLNAEPMGRLPDDVVDNDHRFWGWYTPWLMGQSAFRRDICARKAFSKLRSAIAGIYEYRRMFDEAEYAYRQAIELYPLSPEALFRLAQMFVNIGRPDDAEVILEACAKEDPHNGSAEDFLRRIREVKRANERLAELEGRQAEGGLDHEETMELMQLYRMAGRQLEFMRAAMGVIRDPATDPESILRVAAVFAQEKRVEMFTAALEEYVRRVPDNQGVWLDLGAVYSVMGRTDAAFDAVRKAFELDGAGTLREVGQDGRFQNLAAVTEFRSWYMARMGELRARQGGAVARPAGPMLPVGGAMPKLPGVL